MYLLAGIGNKGQQFNKTRHNVGFLIIDEVSMLTLTLLEKLDYIARKIRNTDHREAFLNNTIPPETKCNFKLSKANC